MSHSIRSLIPILYALLVAVAPDAATARPIEVPAFGLDAGAEGVDPRVAVGTGGSMLFAWRSGTDVRVRLFTQSGVALAAPATVAAGTEPRLAADTRGGYVLAYLRERDGHLHLFGRRLDGSGQPVGAEIAVDQVEDEDAHLPEAVGLPAGFAFVWQQDNHCWLRRYDPDGAPLGDPQIVGENGWRHPLVATALDDGGMAVVWHDPSVHTLLGRTFAPDGAPRAGPSFLPSLAFDAQAIAPSVGGGLVVAGVYLQSTLRVVELDASFAAVRQRDVEVLASTDLPTATIARDPLGRWLLAYATARYDAGLTTLQAYLPPRALPLGVDLEPLEMSFPLAAAAKPRVAAALLSSGSFAVAWGEPGTEHAFAGIVSLCTADVHVCGDGIFDPRCEECDAGAGNDDHAPDTCRTTCVLPSCGDGVVDSGELCDDGTPSPCDGCDDTCRPVAGLVCGDGVLVPGCSEQCDDGNAVAGDGCAPTCTLERIPGGGAPASDCLGEWMVPNPTNVPPFDKRGRPPRTQRCVDDDPACDFDGGVPGSCTFHVAVCARNTDVSGCVPAPLAGWELVKPSAQQAVRRSALAAIRAAFTSVSATLVGAAADDSCTPPLTVPVPLRGTAPQWRIGKATVAAVATASGGRRDKDSLRLVCVPR